MIHKPTAVIIVANVEILLTLRRKAMSASNLYSKCAHCYNQSAAVVSRFAVRVCMYSIDFPATPLETVNGIRLWAYSYHECPEHFWINKSEFYLDFIWIVETARVVAPKLFKIQNICPQYRTLTNFKTLGELIMFWVVSKVDIKEGNRLLTYISKKFSNKNPLISIIP